MTNSIFLVGLSIILLPAIRANGLINDFNQTNYNLPSQLNVSHFLPIFVNSEINSTNGSTPLLPSIEPILLDSNFVHSFVDGGNFIPMVNVSASSTPLSVNYTGLSTLLARHLTQNKDQNVSSSVIDPRLWSSKRVKPLREPVKESTSEPTVESSDGRTSNSFGEELKFDQNYFALLNAVNHRPVPPTSMTINSSDSPKKEINPSSDSVNSTRSLFYYSPETYGKVSHKNHQNTAFSFSWPPPISQPTPTPSTPIKSVSSSSSPSSSSSLNPTSSALISPDHPGKPSKHDSGTMNFLNNSPVIKHNYSSDKQSTANGTIKNDFNANNYLTLDRNKLIVERDQHSPLTTIDEENKMINSNSNNYNGGDDGNEANGDEGTSETNDSDGNSDSNLPGNLIKNVDINTINSNNGGAGGGGGGGNMNVNPNKYYDTGSYMVSKSRSKVSQGPINLGDKNTKPLRFQDHIISQPPLTPSIDYLEEDYESTDAFPDFKNLQPIVKSSTAPGTISTATAKYNGPAPYRHPYYSSYYPTRFYGPPPSPYEEDNSPSKSGANVNSWSGLAGFLLGIIPLGILMASMVPAFVSVPVATAAAGVGRRRRRSLFIPVNSLHDDPVHDILGQYEMKMLRDVDCIKEILCKVAVQGKSQKMGKHFFEATINMRFNKTYHQLGIGKVMEAAKRNECEKVFQCKKPTINR